MAKQKKTAKVNIPICIASVLLCLTLISVHLTSGLYAKYISSSAGSDSARVATFGELTITEMGDFYEGRKLMIIPGVDLKKRATVDFGGSEAATYVFVEITAPNWEFDEDKKEFSYVIPPVSGDKIAMQWAVDDAWKFLEADNGTYVYYCALAPNTKLKNADIIANEGKITVSDKITKSEIKTMIDITIELRAIVVQSGGFANPAAAWKSVKDKPSR